MSTVYVYIYDLSQGLARSLSQQLIGKRLDGIWHTGIVVYNREFFFGSGGIDECEPEHTILGKPHFVENLGKTEIPEDIFRSYLFELGEDQFRGEKYHLFDHNCNNFSDTVAYFLTSKNIPAYVTNLPAEVANTPLGSMVRSMFDQMKVSVAGPMMPTATSAPQAAKKQNPPPKDANNSASTRAIECPKDLITYEEPLSPTVATFSYEENDCKSLESPLRDVFEFATSTQSLTWGLGPAHFQLFGEVKGTASPLDLHILELFRLVLTRNGDLAIGLSRERGRNWPGLITRILACQSEAPPAFHNALMKVVCNWIVQVARSGEIERHSAEVKILAELSTAVLTGPVGQHAIATAAAFNLSSLKVLDEEQALSLASILIYVLTTNDIEEEKTTRQNAMKTLGRLMTTSEDIRDLALVQGLDISSIEDSKALRG